MDNDIKKHYSNGEVTVTWEPQLCQHSTKCWKELSGVFDPRKKPWIDLTGAQTRDIIRQVQQCPSRALGYFMNDQPKDNKS